MAKKMNWQNDPTITAIREQEARKAGPKAPYLNVVGPMVKTRTIQELAKEVLEVQDACNLSGVVLSWGQAILDLRANSPGASTETVNQHPINRLWAEKCVIMTSGRFIYDGEAWGAVRAMAAGE